tara:strand:- start:5 stop:256 length:252 start_codon:yes stop_codon:yes gene_type:complete
MEIWADSIFNKISLNAELPALLNQQVTIKPTTQTRLRQALSSRRVQTHEMTPTKCLVKSETTTGNVTTDKIVVPATAASVSST